MWNQQQTACRPVATLLQTLQIPSAVYSYHTQSFKPAYDLGNSDVLLKFANTLVPSITFSDLMDEDKGKKRESVPITQAA
jgi:hypothetical protein